MRDLNVFVAPAGNAFMTDIAHWIVEAGDLAGRTSRLVVDGSPPGDPDAVNLVVAPHEFYLLSEFDDRTIELDGAVVDIPAGSFCYATDPDGNSIGLFQPKG